MADTRSSIPTAIPPKPKTSLDPHCTLGLRDDASDDDIRNRYLELVRLYPPESEPERFREIHSAYQAACDPLVHARHLLEMPYKPPSWEDVIDEARENPPRLATDLLLSLGNRPTHLHNDSPHD